MAGAGSQKRRTAERKRRQAEAFAWLVSLPRTGELKAKSFDELRLVMRERVMAAYARRHQIKNVVFTP